MEDYTHWRDFLTFFFLLKKEQFFATEYSSLLNKAYNVILHPVTRGEYMLSIAGHPIEEGEVGIKAN